MGWHIDVGGWAMRVAVSIGVFLLVFLAGVRTEWVSVSNAALTTAEDRAYEAVILGETRPDATSAELIDAAVSRAEISAEQGLLYGLYLSCGSDRLPAQFRGRDTAPAGLNVLWEADVDWASLSPETKWALHQFFKDAAQGAASLECAKEIERLASDVNVWWNPALAAQPLPGQTAAVH